jgi:hypothetical protein
MAMVFVTRNGVQYDIRHGGPFDRGAADSYYLRPFIPHYFTGPSYQSSEILPEIGTPEYYAYEAGWEYNEELGDFKDY